jgi:hypothetical protein
VLWCSRELTFQLFLNLVASGLGLGVKNFISSCHVPEFVFNFLIFYCLPSFSYHHVWRKPLVWHSHLLTADKKDMLRTTTINAVSKVDYSVARDTLVDTLKQSRFTLYDVAKRQEYHGLRTYYDVYRKRVCNMRHHGSLVL